jgi:hypothetical protein
MDAENWVVQRGQRSENPNPNYAGLFMRCKRRISKNWTANPPQERVETVGVSFDRRGYEHRRCNQPSDVEAHKAFNVSSLLVTTCRGRRV